MVQLARDPKVVQLAKNLGLNWRGDCLAAVREYALAQVERITRDSPIPIDSLDALRWVVANKFGLKLEFIREHEDVAQIADKYPDFHPMLRRRLIHEFVDGDTEGITLERDEPNPRIFRYLAVVDARGERAPRAYFTAWHEIAHLLVHPEQLAFPEFRRTPPESERAKEPLEALVDHVAGRLAFFPSFFRPALETAVQQHGGLTFTALDAARESAAPTASLYATAVGSIRLVDAPVLLVTAEMGLKAEERRFAYGAQQTFGFATEGVEQKLRVTAVVMNDAVAATSGLAIRRNMRVPPSSVLARAHESETDVILTGDEDQSSWETSRTGTLPPLPLRVEALRRGRYVYGLISPRPIIK